MKAFQNAGGHIGISARPYPIQAGTAIVAGTVVKLSAGFVVKADEKESGPILGIAAETHSGMNDPLNIRSDGKELLVYDNPELIFECAADEMVVSKGTATTMVLKKIAGDIKDDGLSAGKVQLKSRMDGSRNTDTRGVTRMITGYKAEGNVVTVEAGGAAASGDVYWVYPPIGSSVGALDETASRYILSATGATAIKVVGHDLAHHRVRLKAVRHSLDTAN